ncbi:MAG TPA: membrane dipeptidase, partial [Anaerolineales bacterium]
MATVIGKRSWGDSTLIKETVGEAARALHAEAIVINGRDSTPAERFIPEYLDQVRSGGITGMAAITVRTLAGGNNFEGGVLGIQAYMNAFKEVAKDRCLVVKSTADLHEAKRCGKVGVILGFRDLMPIEDNLDYLSMYHDLGIRITQLTYNRQNLLGCGCAEARDSGLSQFGREVVRAIDEMGIVLNLAHAGEKTALEAMDLTEHPPIYSHAFAKGISGHVRGVSDQCLARLAEKGGVVGIITLSSFLCADGGRNGSTLEDYFAHIDYIAERTGVEHIGMGLDNNFGKPASDDNRHASKFPEFGPPPPPEFRI